jgi:hypothetical protein
MGPDYSIKSEVTRSTWLVFQQPANAFEASKQTIEDELGLAEVEYIRVALTPEQVDSYGLPHMPEAVKFSDKRCKRYVQRFGMMAVELDALHPRDLRQLAIEAIENQLDMEIFEVQRQIEQEDQEKLAAIKSQVMELFDKSNK